VHPREQHRESAFRSRLAHRPTDPQTGTASHVKRREATRTARQPECRLSAGREALLEHGQRPEEVASMLAAAEAHRLAGRLSRIPALLDRAEPHLPDPWARATAAGLRAAVALDGGTPETPLPICI
jgi:hypothetical protein